MGLFDKVAKTAGNVGKSVAKSATNVGSSASVAAQEQSELIALKSQINVIDQELNSSYIQIGRKYVDYVVESGDMPGIDVSDILKLIDPKLTKKQELEKKIVELEKEIKSKNVLREKQQAEEEFLAEKSKLDKALAMDVITQDDYDVKLAIARKKVDNFELIRKIEQQAEMGLITKEEKAQKIEQLLN
ncbi:MAG: hypothetical protein IJI39_05010 [Clostridia bacterium]|nr:hypothetical protein [Clostridia bacterium]